MWLFLISVFVTILAVPELAEGAAMPAEAPIPIAEATAPAPAAETPPGRVGRLSLVFGNVSVRASGEWLDALLNFPVATGASLRTGAQARAEIEIGAELVSRIVGLDRSAKTRRKEGADGPVALFDARYPLANGSNLACADRNRHDAELRGTATVVQTQ